MPAIFKFRDRTVEPENKMRHFRQFDAADCGPTCLRILYSHYDEPPPQLLIESIVGKSRDGSSILDLRDAAQHLGFDAEVIACSLSDLVSHGLFPCIAHLKQNHFVVLEGIKDDWIFVHDPAQSGRRRLHLEDFFTNWQTISDADERVALVAVPQSLGIGSAYAKKPEQQALLLTIINYGRDNVTGFSLAALLVTIGALLTGIVPGITGALLDCIIRDANFGSVALLAAGLFLAYQGANAVAMCKELVAVQISKNSGYRYIGEFLRRLLSIDYLFFLTRSFGDLNTRLQDHRKIEQIIVRQSIEVLSLSLNLLAGAIAILAIDRKVALTVLSIALCFFVANLFFFELRSQREQALFKRSSDLSTNEQVLLTGVTSIKVGNASGFFIEQWERKYLEFEKARRRLSILDALQNTGTTFFYHAALVISLLQLAYAARNGVVTAGELTAVSLVIGMVFMPFTQLIGILRSWQDADLAANRIAQVTALSSSGPVGSEAPCMVQPITFINVTFQYPGRLGHRSLENVNLRIPCGQTTAIVGASGAGKSTLIALVLKLLSPTSGQITANGYELNSIAQSSWRNQVSGVLQDGTLFPTTIRDNISLSEVCDEVRLQRAISVCCLDDFITTLPLGVETLLGPEGTSLSGGQKQRILMARAIYRQTAVLALDEATSALDAVTEAQVFQNLRTSLPNTTRIISAHRLSTVRDADQICVLKDGKVVGSGTHNQLVKCCDEYRRLIHHQGETATSEVQEC